MAEIGEYCNGPTAAECHGETAGESRRETVGVSREDVVGESRGEKVGECREEATGTSMEVEESEKSDFEPVKLRRRMTTETNVDDGQEVLLCSNKFSPLAEKTSNNNNATPATGKTTPVVSPSGKSAGEKDGNNNANPAAEKTTPVEPASGKSAEGKKQPPLVVKNMSFARLAKVMSSCGF